MMRKFWLVLFYGFANHLPDSYTPVLGGVSKSNPYFPVQAHI